MSAITDFHNTRARNEMQRRRNNFESRYPDEKARERALTRRLRRNPAARQARADAAAADFAERERLRAAMTDALHSEIIDIERKILLDLTTSVRADERLRKLQAAVMPAGGSIVVNRRELENIREIREKQREIRKKETGGKNSVQAIEEKPLKARAIYLDWTFAGCVGETLEDVQRAAAEVQHLLEPAPAPAPASEPEAPAAEPRPVQQLAAPAPAPSGFQPPEAPAELADDDDDVLY